MAEALAALELQPREEVRTAQGYSLDAVVVVAGCEVAVEVDGPSHFVGRVPTGATALKQRQLRAAGWALLAVPYWEWNEMGGGAARRREYLSRRVAEVVAAGSAPAPTAAGETPAGSPSAPLSWNEFHASVKGQELSKEARWADGTGRSGTGRSRKAVAAPYYSGRLPNE